jgi:hypothetical protein
MKLTVFMHFFNEEFLLPYWLKHHLPFFDHGVLIDYASTDRSREIVKELAPHWEVRSSRNEFFGATVCDREVMAIEREFEGWKLVLNATEFLFHEDPRDYLGRFERENQGVTAVGIPSFVMVDRLEDRGRLLGDSPLCLQKTTGYFDERRSVRRLRYAHKGRDGAYDMGRHGTAHQSLQSDELSILWFGWSPYEEVRARKLQIQTRMPESDKQHGWGFQHVVTEEQLEARFLEEAKMAKSLHEHPRYQKTYERLAQKAVLHDH